MISITVQNRGQAKRLLSNWHKSHDVRNWSLSELQAALQRAVNEQLITMQGVERALNKEVIAPPPAEDRGGNDDSETPPDTDDHEAQNDSDSDDADDGDIDGNAEEHPDSEGEHDPNDDVGKNDDDSEDVVADSKDDGDGEDDDTDSDSDEDDSDDVSEQRDDDAPQDDSGDDEQDEDKDKDEDEDEQEDDQDEQESEQRDDSEDESEDEQDDDSPVDHERLKVVLKYIGAGLNVALVGPAGTGKTFIGQRVADITGRDYHSNGAMMSKYDLIGYKDAHGTYHTTPAHEAFVNGGVHVFDEMDASAPDAVVAFNGMTDDQKYFTFPDGQQVQHEKYVAIACLNTWGNGASADYVGRYKQDAAAMSRFVKVYIGYDPAIEKRCGPKDIVERVQAVRAACEALSIRHIVSTRMIVQATAARKGSAYGKATKAEIDRDIIFAGLDDDAIAQIKSQMRDAS